jgi:hypothetical protein
MVMPKRYFRQLLVLAAVLLAAGCTAAYITNENVTFDASNPDTGMVVFSTRIADKCATPQDPLVLAYLKYEGLVDGNTINSIFLLKNKLIKPDFHHPLGYLWIKTLKAGQYNLYDVGRSYKYEGYDSPISAYFTISPHKITYLGEIYIDVEHCGKRLHVYFHNRINRDGKIFNARMTNLNASMFDYQPPTQN